MSSELQAASPPEPPQAVSSVALAQTIRDLEAECLANPQSADLHTRLGMAYAINFQAYKSMDALEKAVAADPLHFWARMKLAEINCHLRCLERAQEETSRALELAATSEEMEAARKQSQEIGRLNREGPRKPVPRKPLWWISLTVMLLFLLVVISVSRVLR